MKDSTIEKINLLRNLIHQIHEDSNMSFVFAYIDDSDEDNNINISASVLDMLEAQDMLGSIHSILDQMSEDGGKVDLSNYYGKIGKA